MASHKARRSGGPEIEIEVPAALWQQASSDAAATARLVTLAWPGAVIAGALVGALVAVSSGMDDRGNAAIGLGSGVLTAIVALVVSRVLLLSRLADQLHDIDGLLVPNLVPRLSGPELSRLLDGKAVVVGATRLSAEPHRKRDVHVVTATGLDLTVSDEDDDGDDPLDGPWAGPHHLG